jgi:hypothetical protein
VKTAARSIGVAIALCSWFAISNHCAFAALATKTDPVQDTCPFHSKPKEKPLSGAQCCRVLRAIAPVATKSWVRDDANFSVVDFCPEERAGTEPLRAFLALSALDTGPPDVRSFAELILQRSLLAHAPPSLA